MKHASLTVKSATNCMRHSESKDLVLKKILMKQHELKQSIKNHVNTELLTA